MTEIKTATNVSLTSRKTMGTVSQLSMILGLLLITAITMFLLNEPRHT